MNNLLKTYYAHNVLFRVCEHIINKASFMRIMLRKYAATKKRPPGGGLVTRQASLLSGTYSIRSPG